MVRDLKNHESLQRFFSNCTALETFKGLIEPEFNPFKVIKQEAKRLSHMKVTWPTEEELKNELMDTWKITQLSSLQLHSGPLEPIVIDNVDLF